MDAASSPHHLMQVMPVILLFFGIAGIAVPLLHRLRISPVLAYLLCGIAIGPYGLGAIAERWPWISFLTIRETETVQLLGELGIIALMFMIGLELSLGRLKKLRRYIFGLGGAQVVVTAFFIFLAASYFGNAPKVALLVGASFALSSTAIVMKLLEERRLAARSIGALCFSILLMQDLAVVPILVLASALTEGSNMLLAMTVALALGAFTVLVIYALGRRLLTPLVRSVSLSRNPEWLAAFVVFTAVASAVLTHKAGLSLALGAFMVGLLVAETEFKHEVEAIVGPLKGLLLGIFFLSIGMMIDFAEILRHPLLLLLSIIGIYALKAAALFPLCLAFKIPGRQAAEASLYLAQPGEFALLILGVAMATKIMPVENAQFFLLVVATAMLFTPLLFRAAPVAGNYAHRFVKGRTPEDMLPEKNHHEVVIAGFGRVGHLLGQALEEQRIPYIAFDQDAALVQKFSAQGFPVIYGDAKKKELWHLLIEEDVVAIVLAIDDHDAISGMLHSLRTDHPKLPIIVRAADVPGADSLYDNGASYVVAETLESSLRIAELLMHELGTDPNTLERIIEKLREHEYAES